MNLNIVLWLGGMLFSLSIFVVKVGFGLGLGGIGWRGMLLTLSVYLVIFVLTAIFSERLIKILVPVVNQGPYFHAIMALGLMAWGIYLIRTLKGQHLERDPKVHRQNQTTPDAASVADHSALFLLLPCPICLTAIIFSTWAALHIIKLPAVMVGLGLGTIFIILAMLIYLSLKFFTIQSNLLTKRIALVLSIIGIGFYFLASLFIPAYIEVAKSIYQSFMTEGSNIPLNDYLGVALFLLIALLMGFLVNKKREIIK